MNNVCHVARTTDEWQFGDGPPGQPSADYADITLPRWTDALFKFHLTKHSLRLVDPHARLPGLGLLTLDEARTAKFTFTTGRDASEVLADFEQTGYGIDEMESVHITPIAT